MLALHKNNIMKIKNCKAILIIIASFLLTVNVFAQEESLLTTGQIISIKLKEDWIGKSKKNPEFVVANNVTNANGKVLISSGSVITSQVKNIKARGLGRGGKLKVQFLSVNAVDGQTIALSGQFTEKGKDRYGLCFGLTGGLLILLGPFSLPCLAIKGKEIQLNASEIVGTATPLNTQKIKVN